MLKLPVFSARTRWDLAPNRLAAAVAEKRRRGEPILDLTESNPTRCGLSRGLSVLVSLGDQEALQYEPDPQGLVTARRAVAAYYASLGVEVDPHRILLTSSTSEAYAHLFRLLADPGDAVLVPAPCYPLFEHLGRLNDVTLRVYPLQENEGFGVDLEALKAAINTSPAPRALLIVNPGNPTGAFLKKDEREAIASLCAEAALPIVCDEVFSDFAFGEDPRRVRTLAGESRTLTFVLNGISKMLALPQMKLGWIAASGSDAALTEAMARLEMIADTYLSVGTPVQAALPDLLVHRPTIQERLRGRLEANLEALRQTLAPPHPAHLLPLEGGWSAIIRVPTTRGDEEWALMLLEEDGVLVHPGFFFDFPREGRLVVSLLPEPEVLAEGARRLAACVVK